jgi:hypothetical protein
MVDLDDVDDAHGHVRTIGDEMEGINQLSVLSRAAETAGTKILTVLIESVCLSPA